MPEFEPPKSADKPKENQETKITRLKQEISDLKSRNSEIDRELIRREIKLDTYTGIKHAQETVKIIKLKNEKTAANLKIAQLRNHISQAKEALEKAQKLAEERADKAERMREKAKEEEQMDKIEAELKLKRGLQKIEFLEEFNSDLLRLKELKNLKVKIKGKRLSKRQRGKLIKELEQSLNRRLWTVIVLEKHEKQALSDRLEIISEELKSIEGMTKAQFLKEIEGVIKEMTQEKSENKKYETKDKWENKLTEAAIIGWVNEKQQSEYEERLKQAFKEK